MNLPEHSYYENPELMQNYKKLLLTFFKIAYPKNSDSDNQKKSEQLISFEKEFVHIFPKPEIQRQRWSERRQQTQADFIKTYPQIPFTQILAEVPSARTVFNALPEALQFLNNKATAENLNTLKDFYLYYVVSSQMDDAFPKFFEQKFEFNRKYLGGANQRPDRQERCTRTVMETFPKELDQMMIPKLFPHFPTDKFNAVATKIRDSIISGLNKNQWLQPDTKAKAILKIKMAQLYLVQPQNDLEWDFLPVQNFSAKNKIDNSTLFSKNYFKKQITDLNQGINLKAWAMGPLTVNAYYDSSANKFVMPIGILQYPFFNAEGDLIENLGAVGAVIGHELGHGIDDEGSRYDEKGRLQQWMTMKDMKEFSDRSRKLITLFNKAGHNGALTIGENIGDLVGLTFAYNAAFENAKPTKDDQKKLFISYARLWCNVTRPKTAELQLKTNPHALGWARINEQVKHQKSFAEAFDCRSGEPMTLPESERVKIW
jgi:putative endopeptidase